MRSERERRTVTGIGVVVLLTAIVTSVGCRSTDIAFAADEPAKTLASLKREQRDRISRRCVAAVIHEYPMNPFLEKGALQNSCWRYARRAVP